MMSAGRIPLTPHTVRLPVAKQLEAAPTNEPRWVSDNFFYKAIAGYLNTAWAFTAAPYASGRGWASGDLKTANPGDVLFQIIAILGPYYAYTAHVFHQQADVWASVRHLKTAGVVVFGIGTIMHLGFRLGGSKRRLTTTWGAAILSLGGLPIPVLLVLRPFSLWAPHHFTGSLQAGAPGLMSLAAAPFIFGPVACAVAGAHQRSRKSAVGLMIVGSVVTGLLLTRLDPVFTPTIERLVHWVQANS